MIVGSGFLRRGLGRGEGGPDGFYFLRFGQSGQGGLEEEEAEDGKHHEELHEDDDPERAPPGHLPETVAVETPDAQQEGEGMVHVANIGFGACVSK